MNTAIDINISAQATRITFSDPNSNALPGSTLSALTTAIMEADQHPGNVIILQSTGERAFCAGASFDELVRISNKEEGLTFFSGFGNVINAMQQSRKIILVRAQGKAVGGGVGLICAADYSIATRYASVRLSELAIGIGPFVIGPAVERKIGLSAFRKMALTPEEWQTAEWAKQHGMFDEVFDEITQTDEYIRHLIDKWSSYSSEALQALKQIFRTGTEHWTELMTERAKISGELVLSPFTKMAIQAFKKT